LECSSKVIPLEDICQKNDQHKPKEDSCESKKESQVEVEKCAE
jgi:hypothetical protein